MYQMSPDTPRLLYAELLAELEQERLAKNVRKSRRPANRLLLGWRAFTDRIRPTRSLTPATKG